MNKKVLFILFIPFLLTSCSFDYVYDVDNYYEKYAIKAKKDEISLIMDKRERFYKTAELERELIDQGVYLPSYQKLNKRYSKLYDLSPNFYKLYDYKNVITFDKIIPNELRIEANKQHFSDYESAVNYFADRGYAAKRSLTIADSDFLYTIQNDRFGSDIMHVLQTNGHGLFITEFGEAKLDMAESIDKINEKQYTITLKERYWKNSNKEPYRKITATDYINSIDFLPAEQQLVFTAQVVDDNTFTITFKEDTILDIYDYYNWYPYPQENIVYFGKTINLDTYLFPDPDYIIVNNKEKNQYVLTTDEDLFIKDITIKYYDSLEDEEAYLNVIFDTSLDVYATTDDNEEYYLKSSRLENLGSVYNVALYYGDKNTPVYNQAIKDPDFRKSLLIFLKNNYKLYCNYEYYGKIDRLALLPAKTRNDFYDIYLNNDNVTSYNDIAFANMYNTELSEAKRLFDAFKERFKVNLFMHPIELNFPRLATSTYDNLSAALKSFYGNDVKPVYYHGGSTNDGFSPSYVQFFASNPAGSFSPAYMDVLNNLIIPG